MVKEPDSKDISSWMKSAVKGIEGGLGDYSLATSIKFDLAITSEKKGGGDFKMVIASFGASKTSQEVSRISFEIQTKDMSGIETMKEALDLLDRSAQISTRSKEVQLQASEMATKMLSTIAKYEQSNKERSVD